VKAQAESSQKFIGHTQAVSSVSIEADDCAVVTGSYDKSVRRWDVQVCLLSLLSKGRMVVVVVVVPNCVMIGSAHLFI
jgi:WD40 repeat protein